MIRFTKFIAAAAVVASGAIGTVARAQIGSPFSLGVSAGASVPTGDLSDAASTGYTIAGHIGVAIPALPISFRGDAGYNNWGGQRNGHAFNLTGNALFDIPVRSVLHPYVIGGIGGYRFGGTATKLAANENGNRFGYNIGAGITLPLSVFDTFVEVRYHHVNRDVGNMAFVPITVGVMF